MGEVEVVREMIAAGVDVNQADGDGWTPLVHALDAGQAEIAGLLVQKGARVDILASYGQVPLNFAIRSQNPDLVRLLLSRGASFLVDRPPAQEHFMDPVASALVWANAATFAILEESGVSFKTWRDPKGVHNALSLASLHGNADVIRRLLALGCDPNERPPGVHLPLILASMHGHTEAVEVLLEGGADVNASSHANPPIEGFEAMTLTPLTAAVWGHQEALIQKFLALKADPQLPTNAAVHLADLLGNSKIMLLLREAGAAPANPYGFESLASVERPSETEDKGGTQAPPSRRWWTPDALLAMRLPDLSRSGEGEAVSAPNAKLAIIPLAESLTPAAALLTAQLSKEPNLQLLEREQIQAVIREHGLSDLQAGGQASPVRWGHLLGADALVILREYRAEANVYSEARLISASTGAVLGTSEMG